MNRQGLFCFLIVLGFAATQAGIASHSFEEAKKFGNAKALLFELEKLDLERALLEENSDFLIAQTMQSEILLGNKNPETVKQKANEKLFSFFAEKAKETALEFGKDFSKTFLNENSEVLIIEYQNFVFAEYAFTGGLMKNKTLKAKLFSDNAEKTFELPIGYSLKTTAVSP